MHDTNSKVSNIILQFYAIFNFYFILFIVSIDVQIKYVIFIMINIIFIIDFFFLYIVVIC
jgi:hypothetical protein